jgi:hypothetical protein
LVGAGEDQFVKELACLLLAEYHVQSASFAVQRDTGPFVIVGVRPVLVPGLAAVHLPPCFDAVVVYQQVAHQGGLMLPVTDHLDRQVVFHRILSSLMSSAIRSRLEPGRTRGHAVSPEQ